MLDLTGIMFSSVLMLIVIIRALQFDRTQPWFQKITRKDDAKAAAERPWRRPD